MVPDLGVEANVTYVVNAGAGVAASPAGHACDPNDGSDAVGTPSEYHLGTIEKVPGKTVSEVE